MEFEKWAIHIGRFPFLDKPTTKIRPVLIVDSGKDENHVYCAKMTSHEPREEYSDDYAIKHLENSGLQKATTVRLSQIEEIPNENVLDKMGVLDYRDIQNIENLLNNQKEN